MRKTVTAALACVVLLAACDDSSSASGDGDERRDVQDDVAATVVDEGPRTTATSAGGGLVVETSSTRAGLVSAGDVLVTISGEALGDDLAVTRDGADVTSAFSQLGDGVRGLVDGLVDGDNTIQVASGGETLSLVVTNHPKNGPVFSGPHLEPWTCTTERHGLGPALDDDCDAPTKTSWSYVSTDGSVRDLPDPRALPADVTTIEVGGEHFPFVVRTEQGVIDRGVYWIWVLDPDGNADTPWSGRAWNERLVYRFGGGCGTQYSQGAPLGTGLDTALLGRGYAIATNTLDTFQTACNPTLSAEAALMTREHFAEQYGVPEFTIGDGGSGGAIQQLLIAHNYPGLLDALSPSVPFPDAVSISGGVSDCGLLAAYYATERGASLTEQQRTAINGHATTGTCEMWIRLFLNAIDPTTGCDASLADQVYDPQANPDGVRCTLQDINVNVLGRDPETGFAIRPLDNVGVEYGLDALNAGVIGVDQFLDLNEFIGGYDIDGNIVPEREAISEDVAARAYEVGAIIGSGPLDDVPIILRNVYTDLVGDIHTRFHAFSIRDRLSSDADVLLWTTPATGDLVASLTGNIADADLPVVLLDEWLTTGTKPDDAVNRCVLPDGQEVRGTWEIYDEPGPCADAYPVHEDSRLAAGQGRAEDIVKCTLRPVDPDAYEVPFTEAQVQRLATIFPDGVCDWDQPGVGQREPAGTWQRYG